MPDGNFRELRHLSPDESKRLILGCLSSETDDQQTKPGSERSRIASPCSQHDPPKHTRTEPQLQGPPSASPKSQARSIHAAPPPSFAATVPSPRRLSVSLTDVAELPTQAVCTATQTDEGNPYIHAGGAETGFQRVAIAKDLERHTELVHSLWSDLKQWRVETKERALGEEEAVILALRHMRSQVETSASLSQLQISLAERLANLAAHLHTQLSPALQASPQGFVLSGETSTLRQVIHRTTGQASQTPTALLELSGVAVDASMSARGRCLSVEEGYGDSPAPYRGDSAGPMGVRGAIEAELQKVLRVCPSTGDMSLDVEDLAAVLSHDSVARARGGVGGVGGGGVPPSATSMLLEKILLSREELGGRIVTLNEQVSTLRSSEREKDAVHRTRVAQLMEKVKSLQEERDELAKFKETNKQRVDDYAEAFSAYRDNMNVLRGRCDELIRENYELKTSVGAAAHPVLSSVPATSVQGGMAKQERLPQTPTRGGATRFSPLAVPLDTVPHRQANTHATVDVVLSPGSCQRSDSFAAPELRPDADWGEAALPAPQDVSRSSWGWGTESIASPSPVKPAVLQEGALATPAGQAASQAPHAPSVDMEFQVLSSRMEQKLSTLGLKLTSPTVNNITSLSPDYTAVQKVRSVSPSRYYPRTPSNNPPEYSPAVKPPFVQS